MMKTKRKTKTNIERKIKRKKMIMAKLKPSINCIYTYLHIPMHTYIHTRNDLSTYSPFAYNCPCLITT